MSNTDDSIETMLVRLRCESITPLGRPVVPEVKISEASDCAVTRCGSSAMRSSSVCFIRQRKHLIERPDASVSPSSVSRSRSSGCSSIELLAENNPGGFAGAREVDDLVESSFPDRPECNWRRSSARRNKSCPTRARCG